MNGGLYDTDYYTWTKRQAAALRELAARPGSNAVDWPNLIEEVEDLGKNVVRAVDSALFRLMEHAALVALAPADHPDRPHWLGEMRAFRRDAAYDYLPSMRQRVVPRLRRSWLAARDGAGLKLRWDVTPLPDRCPWSLAELLHTMAIETLPDRLRPGPQ